MKKTISLVAIVILALAVVACSAQPKAANSSEAIQQAKELPNVEQQEKYLVGQANAFINSQNFDEAVKTARYVLAELDKESAEAQNILKKAEGELKKLAQKKLDELKGKVGAFGQ